MYKIIVILSTTLIGCAGMQPQEFSNFNDHRLCASPRWVVATHKEELIAGLVNEARNRHLLTEDQIRDVHNRKASIGDNTCYMIATYGESTKDNITQTQHSYHVQHIYKKPFGTMYIYTENDIITAIQY